MKVLKLILVVRHTCKLRVCTGSGHLDSHRDRVNMGDVPFSLLGHEVIPQLPDRIEVKGPHREAKPDLHRCFVNNILGPNLSFSIVPGIFI